MDSAPLEANLRVSDYVLLRPLGRGGMGEVWLASEQQTDRPVALKFIRSALLDEDPSFRIRFLNEARTLARLEHERIVALYRVLDEGGRLALVLRYIEGVSLAKIIDQYGGLPVDYVLACARDILSALGFAHSHGVIHRDIKAENILIDQETRFFLSDFGIAAAEFAQRGTMTGAAIGTPGYMSPEQIRDSRALSTVTGGHRSDIYSFGVLLFEMLTGRLPFPGRDASVFHAHLLEPPPAPSSLRAEISPALEAVVLRCLEKNPEARPQTCAELLEWLEFAATADAAPPARAATVMENAPVAEKFETQKFETMVLTRDAIAARKPPRPFPKWAWLAIGLVLIVASVGYALLTSSKPAPATATPQPAEFHVPPNAAASPAPAAAPPPVIAAGPNSQAEALLAEAQSLAAQGMNCEARARTDRALAIAPGSAKIQQLQRELIPKCLSEQKSDAMADDARRLAQQGKACEGKQTLASAMTLNPARQSYAPLMNELNSACAASSRAADLARDAEDKFQHGQYCGAQTAMEQAIAADPQSAALYRPRREVMANGCRAIVQ